MTDAARWYAEVLRKMSPQRWAEFKQWLQDREHRLQFAQVSALRATKSESMPRDEPATLPALPSRDVTIVPTDEWEIATYCDKRGRLGVGFRGPQGEIRHLLVFEDERALRCLHGILNEYLVLTGPPGPRAI